MKDHPDHVTRSDLVSLKTELLSEISSRFNSMEQKLFKSLEELLSTNQSIHQELLMTHRNAILPLPPKPTNGASTPVSTSTARSPKSAATSPGTALSSQGVNKVPAGRSISSPISNRSTDVPVEGINGTRSAEPPAPPIRKSPVAPAPQLIRVNSIKTAVGNNNTDVLPPKPKPRNNINKDEFIDGVTERVEEAVRIEANTQEEESTLLGLEMDAICGARKIDNGLTLAGKNLDLISRSTPTHMKTVTLKITNYLDVLLVNPEFLTRNEIDATARSGVTPHSIGSCSREALLFHDNNHSLDIEGLFTYQIGNTNLRLAVLFAVLNDASTWLYGIAFIPRSTQATEELYNYMSNPPGKNPFRPDVKFGWIFAWETKELIARHGNYRARVVFMPGRKVLMEVEIAQVNRKEANEKRLVHTMEGQTLLPGGKTVEGLAASISEKYGCVIEMTNGLSVSLEEAQYFSPNSLPTDSIKIPKRISARTREAFHVADSGGVHGIFLYKLNDTDLALAVVFRSFLGGNSFAVAFVPGSSSSLETLFTSLTDFKLWKTHPNQKFASANDGEKVVEIRNIRARVRMTENAKAILTVAVGTF